MGTFLSTASEFAKEGANRQEEHAYAELKRLSELTQSKLDLLKQEIIRSERTAHSKENTTIAITDTIATIEDVMIEFSVGTEQFKNSIKSIVSSFIKGGSDGVKNGIVDGVCTLINSIIGTSFGTE